MEATATGPCSAPNWIASHCWPAAAKTPGCAFPPPSASAASTEKPSLHPNRSARMGIIPGNAPAFAMQESRAGFATRRCRGCWQRGSGTRPLRLIVVVLQPYKLSKQARTNYRDPAYLLTLDLKASVRRLLQAYFDRWQIEINHREEKQWLGLGQAQVWSKQSVPRHPAFVVACYSLLLLASLRAYGPGRSDAYWPLPK